MNWRPIATADLALDHCLIAGPHRGFTGEPFVGLGFWDGGGWRLVISVHGNARDEPVDPTHWMPLPSLPAAIVTAPRPMPDFRPAPLPMTPDEVIAAARQRERETQLRRHITDTVAGMVSK